MGKLERLEEEKKKVTAATTALADKVGESAQIQQSHKLRLWDESVPILRSSVEQLLRDGNVDFNQLKEVWFNKAMSIVFGPQWLDHVNTLRT